MTAPSVTLPDDVPTWPAGASFGRRRALWFGSVASAALVAQSAAPTVALAATSLPVSSIEQILGASGTVSNGVLSVTINRNDLTSMLPGGIPVTPAFQLNGTLTFQPLDPGAAFLNGDFCLKPQEVNPFIDALIARGITVQALHQHLFDLSPLYWFEHFRAVGNPLQIAHAVRAAINTTSTPLPQSSSMTTPFQVDRLTAILGGSATVADGVVTVSVARREHVFIDGIHVLPQANISAPIAFQPLDAAGTQAVVVPDFALRGFEVNAVFQAMRGFGWTIGCLYNQETEEHPQLYFSHMWKAGDPYALAQEVRAGLDLTNSQFTS